MKLEHTFTVPAPVPAVWAALLDPEKVAPCLPGAALTGVDGRAFTGTVKVKLGPVVLVYKGTGEFTAVAEQERTAVLKASGKDSRGNGTAAATVSLALVAAAGGTAVSVVTDLTITGRPAQLGRGLISEVSGKIVGQFADCLATRLATGEAGPVTTPDPKAAPEPDPAPPAKPAPEAKPGPAKPATAKPGPAKPKPTKAGPTKSGAAAKSAPAKPEATAKPGVAAKPVAESGVVAEPEVHAEPETAAAKAGTAAADEPRAASQDESQDKPQDESRNESRDEAPARPHLRAVPDEPIDLLETAGAPVAKRALPIVVALVVLVLLLRRRRRRQR
ncbi:SRPBCC family protein [Actinosynnema sp. NPDC047251]|uniref:Carbon monoxide dehydrogenase subunit G n=1 Tax=Saccharothrix espanaensis (strain ATCC 51144 / DSM 44229 / JCM 9112 / NBRC 15066 / NRRL 15764) TaxID=1179773 RepID=K0JQC6_SACES|nr:SRPBCC family protein [Saccharothrix espanaensis]CCH27821.1 hypothetical protein BN6_04910 [Saccharothrix espanaensis DSM 44229]